MYKPGWRRWFDALLKPQISNELRDVLAAQRQTVPVIWLLGKTGSGKSSIVQALTGDDKAQIGNGFEPCTTTAHFYNHPNTAPVMRFLDTRGLGESEYDPSDDLAFCQNASHVALIITRVDDPNQTVITDALKQLVKLTADTPILHIHSALHTVSDDNLTRAIKHNADQIKTTLGFEVQQVNIDFTQPEDGFNDQAIGLAQLQTALIELAPKLAHVVSDGDVSDDESRLFNANRKQVIGHAGAAAAVDVVPAVGMVAVPSIQGKLLHALAGAYGLPWDRKLITEFVTALGSGFLYRYAVSLLIRQAGKFVPVYGQSAGAAAAASISFASTYALGRAACLYFYKRSTDQRIDPEQLRSAFTEAFKSTR